MAKRLLVLGGSRYVLPVISAAHELGHEVITMDYLPGNIAHRFSDQYEEVSIVDKEAVLAAADKLGIDGIMSFAADPGVITAAYVAEALGLPFQGSARSVEILQNKGLFRAFLKGEGFNCPDAHLVSDVTQAREMASDINYPVIVKPTDSAGSKGCSRVDDARFLELAVEQAFRFSLSHTCIIEQFIEKKYPSSDADGFTIDGRFECLSFTAQLFDASAVNPFVPAGYDMPCAMPDCAQMQLRDDLQRLSTLLQLNSGVYNVETRVGTDDKAYIMEVSPRGGGNRLCEMLRYSSGIDLIRAAVQVSVGDSAEGVNQPVYDGFWHQRMLHSENGGVFRGIWYADGFKDAHVQDEQLWIKPGTAVQGFSGANHAFGSVFLRFDTKADLEEFHEDEQRFMRTVVD